MNIIYDVKWSQESIYDVVDILDYVEIQFDKMKADEIAAKINATGKSLGETYNQHSESDILYGGMTIRKRLLKPSILFYVVDDKIQTVLYSQGVAA